MDLREATLVCSHFGKLLLLSRFSRVQLCVTPQTAAHQAPPSLGFSRQEHWSGLPFPSPMHDATQEITCSAGDKGSIPGLGRSPREENGYPLQNSCLENSMEGGSWFPLPLGGHCHAPAPGEAESAGVLSCVCPEASPWGSSPAPGSELSSAASQLCA